MRGGAGVSRSPLLRFLWDIFEEWDLAFFLLRQLTRSGAGIRTFEEFLYTVGSASNGKDTIIALMNAALGVGPHGYAYPLTADYFVAGAKRSVDGPSPLLAALEGKRFAPVTEPRQGCPLDTAMLKRVTEQLGTPIVTHGKFKDPKAWLPEFLLFFACNGLPPFEGDGGIRRRFTLLHFPLSFVPVLSVPPRANERVGNNAVKAQVRAHVPELLLWFRKLFPGLAAATGSRILPIPELVQEALDDVPELQEVPDNDLVKRFIDPME